MNENWHIGAVEWLATFLALGGPLAAVLRLGTRTAATKAVLLAVCCAVPFIPIWGLSVSQYFLTIVGHLSVTSMTLLAFWLFHELAGTSLWKKGERTLVSVGVLGGSLLLYPAAFGLISFDAYQLGYRSVWFVVVLMALAVAAAVTKRNIAFTILAASAAAFQLHLLQSTNLWDYLLDPLLAILAIAGLTVAFVRQVTSFRRSMGGQPTDIQ